MRKDNSTGPDISEWKREVAEKVKAYGERKKRLTTPPGPIRETDQQETSSKPEPTVAPERHSRPGKLDPEPPGEVRPTVVPVPAANPSLEIWTGDLDGLITEPSEEKGATGAGIYLIQRSAAFIIDHIIIIVLLSAFLFLFSAGTGEPVESVIVSGWKGVAGAFLFIHCIYYLYFYHSSRQTPGMVFLSLELKDLGASSIPATRILARWLAMVLLNVFNLLPLLFGRRYLLLDQISGTEMRSFK